MNQKLKEQVLKAEGDIFKIFISLYDFMDDNCLDNEDMEFYKNIFKNIKTSEDNKILENFVEERPKKIKDYYEYIDKTNLRINSRKDFELIEKMLYTITTKAIVMRFKYPSKEEARKAYLDQIEYLKYGILKKEE